MFKVVPLRDDTIKREGFSFRKKAIFGIVVFLMSFFSFIPFVSADTGLNFTVPLKWMTFLIIVGVMLFLLGFGLVARIPFFLVVGFLLLFIIGGYLQAGNILIPSGTVDSVYGNNFTGYHWDGYNGSSEAPSQTDREAYLFHEEQEFELISFAQSHIIGLFLMVISIFAMMFSLFIGVGGGSF